MYTWLKDFQASTWDCSWTAASNPEQRDAYSAIIGAFVLSHSSGAFLFVLAGVTGIIGLFAVYIMTARKGVKQTLDAKSPE